MNELERFPPKGAATSFVFGRLKVYRAGVGMWPRGGFGPLPISSRRRFVSLPSTADPISQQESPGSFYLSFLHSLSNHPRHLTFSFLVCCPLAACSRRGPPSMGNGLDRVSGTPGTSWCYFERTRLAVTKHLLALTPEYTLVPRTSHKSKVLKI